MEHEKLQEQCDYIEVDEIARLMGVCEETVRTLVRDIDFPSLVLGKKTVVIPRAAFMRWYTDPERIVAFKQKRLTREAGS